MHATKRNDRIELVTSPSGSLARPVVPAPELPQLQSVDLQHPFLSQIKWSGRVAHQAEPGTLKP